MSVPVPPSARPAVSIAAVALVAVCALGGGRVADALSAQIDCNACGTGAATINDFTSRAAMEANGWHFGWDDRYDFLTLPNSQFCNGVPSTSYCGFQHPGDALLTLTLVGSGSGTLDFGNSWTAGNVWAHLNGELLGIAGARNLSVVANFTFGYGDVLTLSEYPDAVNVINSLTFSCPTNRPRRWLTTMTAGSLRICDDVTACSSLQYQVSAATSTSDTVCRPITTCLPGLQHQAAAATATTDTVCASNTPCTAVAPAASTMAPTARPSVTPAPTSLASSSLFNAQIDCNACGSAAANINDFSSRPAMEANGWRFSWRGTYSFLTLPNSHYCSGVPTTSYCGFQHPGDAQMTLTLVGSGSGTLDFGNAWTNGNVWVHLNGELLGFAEPRNLSVVVNFEFGYGDVLSVSEYPDAVNVINSLRFTCSANRPQRWLTTKTAGSLPICDDVTVCSSSQYRLSAATSTSDAVCRPITSCLPGLQHQAAAATATTDTVCAAIALDGTRAPTASSSAPTAMLTTTPAPTAPQQSAAVNAQVDCNGCGSAAANINDYTSRAAMVANGWRFSWSDSNSFLTLPNSRFCGGVPSTSYCGYQHPGDSLLTLTLVGSGQGTLDFGNSWTNGNVWAYLNGELLGIAEPRNLSVVVSFAFGHGDVLSLTEYPDAVNVINSLTFSCPAIRPRQWRTAMTAGLFRICNDVTACSSSQYQVSAATSTSDTVCRPITTCLPGLQHQAAAATATTDTVCVLVACAKSGGAATPAAAIAGVVAVAVLVVVVAVAVLARKNRLPQPRRWFRRPGRAYAVVSGAYDGGPGADSNEGSDSSDDELVE